MYSGMGRIEASVGSPTNVTFYRPVEYTILLLDKEYTDTLNINANVVITFASVSKSVWFFESGNLLTKGSSFKYGRIKFGAGVQVHCTNNVFLDGTTFSAANCIQLHWEAGSIMSTIGADHTSPNIYLGEFKAWGAKFIQKASIVSSHFIHVICGGDILIFGGSLEISCDRETSAIGVEPNFIANPACRLCSVIGLDVLINDPLAKLLNVYLINDAQASTGKIVVATVNVSYPFTSAANVYVVKESSAGANTVFLSDVTINAPTVSGTKAIYTPIAGSTSVVRANNCSGGTITSPSGGSLTVDSGEIPATLTTGGGTASLGTNCPAVTPTAPFGWEPRKLADGSTGYVAIFK
jgi:hypothetical protein